VEGDDAYRTEAECYIMLGKDVRNWGEAECERLAQEHGGIWHWSARRL
jgi:hypothetical protein